MYIRKMKKAISLIAAFAMVFGLAAGYNPVKAKADPVYREVYSNDPMINYQGGDPHEQMGYPQIWNSFTFTFTGVRFKINAGIDAFQDGSYYWGGYFDIYINGVKTDSGNSIGPEQYPAIIYDSGTMAPGTYTVEFKVTSGHVTFESQYPLLLLYETEPGPGTGTTYYVSASGGDDTKNGTSESTAWKTLRKASSVTLQPGDQLLLKRGDVWHGETLAPKGKGTEGSEIVIGAYGNLSDPLPIINAGTNLQAVYMQGMEYTTLQDLELTNNGIDETAGGPVKVPNVHSGVQSIKLEGPTDYKNMIGSTFMVEPQTKYTFGLWIKGTGMIQLFLFDSSWTYSSASGAITGPGNMWTYVSYTVTTGNYTSAIPLIQQWDGAALMYIDDISFIKAGDATEKNLMPNPDFEARTGWSLSGNFTWYVQEDEPDSDAPRVLNDGDSVLKLNGTASYANMYVYLAVEPNTDYDITLYAKSFPPGTGSNVLRVVMSETSNWSEIPITNQSVNLNDTWQKARMTTRIPAGVTQVYFALQDWGAKCYIDDITFTRADGTGSNLISDPTGTKGSWTRPSVFTVAVWDGGEDTKLPTVAVPVDKDRVHSGDRSLKFTSTATAAGVEYDAAIRAASNTYTYSAWISGSGPVRLNVMDGNTLQSIGSATFVNTGDGTWKHVTFDVTVPAGTKWLTPRVETGRAAGIAYIDDVSFGPKGGGSVFSPLDSGFEEGGWNFGLTGSTILRIAYRDGAPREGDRRGLYVTATYNNGQPLHNLTLRNLVIHDVFGSSDVNYFTAYSRYNSAAILFHPLWENIGGVGDSYGYYDGLTIENCYIYDVTCKGIYLNATNSSYSNRSANVVVRNTVVRHTGSDAIEVGWCNKPVLEYNVSYDAGHYSPWPIWMGGIWTYGCNSPVTQYCEVARVRHGGDSSAFDVDFGHTGTVLYQYNYTRDNGGGMIMLYYDNYYDAVIIRYNISQNDRIRSGATVGTIKINTGKCFIYNNMFFSDCDEPYGGFWANGAGGNLATTYFENNIFYVTNKPVTYNSRANWDNNAYFGHEANVNDKNGFFGDPKLADPGKAGYTLSRADNLNNIGMGPAYSDYFLAAMRENCAGYMLQDDSPLIGMGKVITFADIKAKLPNTSETMFNFGNGLDFFGNPLGSEKRDIGVHETNAAVAARPAAPVLALDTDAPYNGTDGTKIWITNYGSYDVITYGALEYTLTLGGEPVWVPYDGLNGITGLLAATEYTVKVRYAGTGGMAPSAQSESASITTGNGPYSAQPPTPAKPGLTLDADTLNSAWITNITDYDTDTYGRLQFSVNNEDWLDYDGSIGITGLQWSASSLVRVRYGGTDTGIPAYVPSAPSLAASIVVGDRTFGTMYPAPWTKVNDNYLGNDIVINYVGGAWVSVARGASGFPAPPGYSGNQNEYMADCMATNNPGDFLTVDFVGTAIDFISQLTEDQGDISVYMDDVFIERTSLWRSGRWCQQLVYRVSDLADGPHTLKIVSESDGWFCPDAFIVYGGEVIPGTPELSYDSGVILIDNYADYAEDIALYGALQYSLNGGVWMAYDSTSGIGGAVNNSINTVAVRYAGKTGAQGAQPFYYNAPSFRASRASEAAEITAGTPADKTDLDALIALIDKMIDDEELDIYDKQSVADLLDELSAARIVSNDDYATQGEVNDAFDALSEAYGNLQTAVFSCAVKSMLAKVGKQQVIPIEWDGYGAITITSSNTAVCRVDGRTIMPLKVGAAVITIEAPNGARVVFAVTVSL